jgi:glycosyltransferase involved in cell wall biosynthesis
MPSVLRQLRHKVLARFIPVIPMKGSRRQTPQHEMRADDVAVIIPCHNYARYLAGAIESVLNQTFEVREILVIDDCSSDNTEKIAQKYADKGVVYMRSEWDNISLARNAGAAATTSPFLLFLDADDRLDKQYVSKCLQVMHDPRVGIAYGDLQCFGDETTRRNIPAFDRGVMEKTNFISSHALMRRQAFDIVGGYRVIPHAYEDWDLYQRILGTPYTAVRANAMVLYNVHHDSRVHRLPADHFNSANVAGRDITIFTPFCGRTEVFERYLAGLKHLECDHSTVHLHWYNNSGNPEFDALLRGAIGSLPFASVTYTYDPLPDLWKTSFDQLVRGRMHDRRSAYLYEMAVVRAYNVLQSTCTTPLALTLEDDIIPEPGTLQMMLKAMDEKTVAVVAPYRCPVQGYYIVWEKRDDGQIVHFTEKPSGTGDVGGSGFGCSLFRMHALRRQPIFTRVDLTPPNWYDIIAFGSLAEIGNIRCVWDAHVDHLSTERFLPSDHQPEYPQGMPS